MAFIGCSEFQWTKFAWKLLIELKRYRSKVKVFWNAWAVGFHMVKLKNLSCTKIIVHGRTLLKSVSAVGFTEKPSFLESVSFHGEMFCVTNFWLVLVICIVITMIFIKKNIDKLVQDQFLQPVKDHPYDKFGYVEKIMPCFFSSNTQKLNLVVKNPKTWVWAFLKCAGTHVHGFVITKFSFCVFEKKNMSFNFSKILRKTELFKKCLVSPWNGWFD